VPDLDHYNVYRGGELVGQSATTTFTDSNVPVGDHTYQVSAVDTHGNEGTKSAGVVKTYAVPTTPTNFRRVKVPPFGVKLQWDRPGFSTFRHVEVWHKLDAGSWNLRDTTTGNEWTEKDLAAGVHYWKLKSVDEYGNESSYTGQVQQTVTDALTAPAWIETSVSGRAVRLLWDPLEDVEDLDRFEVERDGAVIGKANGNTYADSGLPDGSYSYRVRAVDEYGNVGAWSSAASQSVPDDTTVPGAPSDVRAILEGDGVRVTWDNPTDTDIAYYLIYSGRSGSGPWTKIGKRPYGQTFHHRQVSGGQTVYYKVTAVDESDNESADSNVESIEIPLPDEPANLRAAKTGGDVVLYWDMQYLRERFVRFDVFKKSQDFEDDFNYAGSVDTSKWTDISSSSPAYVDGTRLNLYAAKSQVISNESFLLGTLEMVVDFVVSGGHGLNWFGWLSTDLLNGIWIEATNQDVRATVRRADTGATQVVVLGSVPGGSCACKLVWYKDGSTFKVDIYCDTVLKHTFAANVPTVAMPIYLAGSTGASAPTIYVDDLVMSPDFYFLGNSQEQAFRDKAPVPSDSVYTVRNVHVLEETRDSDELLVSFPIPTAPANFRSEKTAGGDVALAWDAPEDDVEFEIWLDRGSGYSLVDRATSTSHTWYAHGETGAKNFKVRARDQFGQYSGFSNVSTQTLP